MAETMTQTQTEIHRHRFPPPAPKPAKQPRGTGPEPEKGDGLDFEGFLLKCVKQRPKPVLPASLVIDQGLDDHEKAIQTLMWGYKQPKFRGQKVHYRVLYMAARLTATSPKLAQVAGGKYKDGRFQEFCARLNRAASRVFENGGMLLKFPEKELVTEMRKGEKITYEIRVVHYAYTDNPNDRQMARGGVESRRVTLDRAQKRFTKGHESIDRTGLSEENRVIYDQHARLAQALGTERMQQLFKPRTLALKNGAIGDPTPKKK